MSTSTFPPRPAEPAPQGAGQSQAAQLTAGELRDWLNRESRPQLIDVRAAAEFRAGHIPGARNVPLPILREHVDELSGRLSGQPIVLICRTDRRAWKAGEFLDAAAGPVRWHVLAGGMTAWEQEQGPVARVPGPWALERQIRLVTGGIVAGSVVASPGVPPARGVAGVVGAGRVAAALTDTCLMGEMLSRLPCNRQEEPALRDVLAGLDG